MSELDSPRHAVTIRIPFANNQDATIAKQVIDVDAELQKDAVKRSLTVEGNELIATFQTLTVRLARLAVNGFLENVDLVIRTMAEFSKPPEHSRRGDSSGPERIDSSSSSVVHHNQLIDK